MLKDTVKPVVTGFKLLASETKWVFIRGFRRWEIRQMEKRLAEEYQNLGKSYAESLAKGEAFLREELAHLEQELATTRAEYVKGRTEESGV
jgi:hypothetical protein